MTTAIYGTFGSGGAEPYARALRSADISPSDQMLYLREADSLTRSSAMNVSRWNENADLTDLSLLSGTTGAVIDIGCGPGRMVRAAMSLGLMALGIDVSPTAIEIARESGLPVLDRSVFERLPREGSWATALLVDGNIGIGGDPSALLERCREIIAPDGTVVVEVDRDSAVDRSFSGTVVDIDGHASDEFPWAEIGSDGLVARAATVGLRLAQSWVTDGRAFCRLRRA